MASVMVWCASGLSEPSDMAEAMKRLHDGRSGFHLVQRQRGRGGTNLQQITQHGGLVLDRQGAEGGPGLRRRQAGSSGSAGGSGHHLQSLDGLRLPAVRLGTIVFAEAHPAVVGESLGFRGRDRLLRGAAVAAIADDPH